ncbi:hypothetical protein [Gordonia iterans]|uniref:hypothetical protein n=1 Tax=Gordonia iterans TaxID=1004901 RepID=UPI00131AEB79|nr:hypothetical protein [Gordonia iterans]
MASRVETCGGVLSTRHAEGQWFVEAYFPGVDETLFPAADEAAAGCLLRGPANPVREPGVAGT